MDLKREIVEIKKESRAISEQKKVQQLQTNLWNLSGINPNAAVIATGNPQYLAV